MSGKLDEVIGAISAAEPFLAYAVALTGTEGGLPILYASRRFWDRLGYGAGGEADMPVNSLSELLPETEWRKLTAGLLVGGGNGHGVACQMRCRDGSLTRLLVSTRPYRTDKGDKVWFHQFL